MVGGHAIEDRLRHKNNIEHMLHCPSGEQLKFFDTGETFHLFIIIINIIKTVCLMCPNVGQ